MRPTSSLLFVIIVGLLATVGSIAPAQAQIAGATPTGVTAAERSEIAVGWSVKRSILGKVVYNERNERIGKVEDLIITPNKFVSYVIIGAGGFVGIGRHDVAFPISQIRELGGKIVLSGGTKEIIKAMPQFVYASSSTLRDQFTSRADQDIANAKVRIAELKRIAETATAEAKIKINLEVASLQQEMHAVEVKLAAMKKATAKRWKDFETELNAATFRLRESLKKSAA